MASYRGHLALSCPLGFVYGGLGHSILGLDPATSLLGAGATAVAGLLPDLDSDSGVPIREMFNLAAVIVPLALVSRLSNTDLTESEILIALAVIYAVIRWGLSRILKRVTVHRGMFHSVPAMLVAGGVTFLAFHNPSLVMRGFMAVGMMVGFLSHLILDELCSVDFRGLRIKLNQFAGSAVKFWSKSIIGTTTCYALLALVGYGVVKDLDYQLPYGLKAAILGGPPPAVQVVIQQPTLTPFPPGMMSSVIEEPVIGGVRNMGSPVRPGHEESEIPRK